jgi:hypothetical protein
VVRDDLLIRPLPDAAMLSAVVRLLCAARTQDGELAVWGTHPGSPWLRVAEKPARDGFGALAVHDHHQPGVTAGWTGCGVLPGGAGWNG